MGQLERYGLYVLCLVIFLILGIAIWGDSSELAIPKDATGTSLRVTSATGPEDTISDEHRRKLEREAHLNEVVRIIEAASEPVKLPVQRVGGKQAAVEETARTPLSVAKVEPKFRIHVVKRYETLEEISRRYLGKRKRWRSILALNPGVRPTALKPGMKLKIPPLQERQDPEGKGSLPATVTVRRGDNPGLISQRLFGTTRYAKEIMRLNDISDATKLPVGATLKIPQIDGNKARH